MRSPPHLPVCAGLFALLILGCGLPGGPARAGEPIYRPRLDDLAWLAGSWVSNENGARAEEIWMAPEGGLMVGAGRNVGPTQLRFEFLRISASNGVLTLWASPLGQPATPFPLKSITSDEAVFENLAHDAPNVITYRSLGADAIVVLVEDIDPDTGARRGFSTSYRRQR